MPTETDANPGIGVNTGHLSTWVHMNTAMHTNALIPPSILALLDRGRYFSNIPESMAIGKPPSDLQCP